MSSTDATGGYGTWAQITQRALADPDFRESLLLDPRATIEDATGIALPDDTEIVVLENTSDRIHLVLPSTDVDLGQMDVSGGITCSHMCGGPGQTDGPFLC